MNLPRRYRAGFVMTEMLATLALTAAFLTLGSQLLITSARLSHDAATAQNDEARFDSALAALRRDVWNARRIAIKNTRQVVLTDSKGGETTWQSDDEGALVRTASSGPTRWPDIGRGMTFSQNGAELVVDLKTEGQVHLMALPALLGAKP